MSYLLGVDGAARAIIAAAGKKNIDARLLPGLLCKSPLIMAADVIASPMPNSRMQKTTITPSSRFLSVRKVWIAPNIIQPELIAAIAIARIIACIFTLNFFIGLVYRSSFRRSKLQFMDFMLKFNRYSKDPQVVFFSICTFSELSHPP